MPETLILTLKPHIETRAGLRFHAERLDALLGDEVICTSRSGWHDPARALLARGHSPDTLLHVQHAGKPFDPTIVPQPIGELAEWTYEESDRTGIRKRRWRPVEERFEASPGVGMPSPEAADEVPGTPVPQAA